MVLTLAGMITLARDAQLEKALFPMLVILSGIVISVRDSHPLKAESPMQVTPS